MSKQTKQQVNYRPAERNKRCGLCTMFRKPNGCTAVQGPVDPAHGLCDLFNRKGGK